MSERKTFGRILRDMRLDADKTMLDAARCLGTSVVVISDMEHDRTPPLRPEHTLRLCKLYGLDPTSALEAAASAFMPQASEPSWNRAFRDLRVCHKVSLRQIGHAMGVSTVSVGELERGLVTSETARRAAVRALAQCLEGDS